MTFLGAVPVLPVADIQRAVEFYTSRLGFESRFAGEDYGIVARDEVEIHLWAANKPNVAGAEPELAGTASCRLRVSGIDDLYEACVREEITHPRGALQEQPWGTREFTVLDADRNALTLFEPGG